MPANERDATSAVLDVSQNVETIAAIHAAAEQRVDRHQRRIEAVTRAIARPRAIAIILAIVASWIAYNAVAPTIGAPRFDAPPFYWLQGATSLGALVITILVLATQHRQTIRDAKRDHLDLQVNLLAEQKITKAISLIEELRRDLPIVKDRRDPVAEAMTRSVDPEVVVSALEATLKTPKPK